MKTKMLYYPNFKNPDLEVEVTENGDIVEAFAFVPAFDRWIDAKEYLKDRPKKIEEIRMDAGCLDWRDGKKNDEWTRADDWALSIVKGALRSV